MVSEIEGERGNTSYTIDTLNELSRLYRQANFHLIVGADALAEFHLWHRHGELRKLTRIAYVGRPGSKEPSDTVGATRLAMPATDVSSTMIRDRVRRGLAIDGFVPPAVAEYIAAHRLYSA
jgi:nicotinate-nucleotide adenylyltransferase